MRRSGPFFWITSLSPMAMAIVVGLAMFIPAAIVSDLLFDRSEEAIRQEIRDNLRRVAKAASSLVDPELHKTFVDPAQETSAEYEQAVSPLRGFITLDSDIIYVYTCVLRDGKVYFVLDPTASGDRDRDGVDDKSHIMQVYNQPSEQMLGAFKYEASAADTEPYSDDWGTFISGYAPIFDKDGKFVAIIGVDLAADQYSARLATVRSALYIALFVAAAISATGAFAALYFQRRRLQWALAQSESAQALREIADTLDSANTQLQLASRRFEQLFNWIPVACFTIDCEGKIFEFNHEAYRLTSRPAESVVQKSVFETIVSERNHHIFQGVISGIKRGLPTLDLEWSDEDSLGGKFTVVVSAFPIHASGGEVTGGIVACADITMRKVLQGQIEQQIAELQSAYKGLDDSQSHLKQANERLALLAATDGLTGVNNRRTIFESLGRTVSTSDRSGQPLSVLMIDIDHFKLLNDTHGHIAGDTVLKWVANQLKSVLRLGDEVGRFGGEEFIVVLPDTDPDAAILVAERIRTLIADSNCEGISTTVSIGVSTLGQKHESADQLIEDADRALYEAKRGGRNRVVHSRNLKGEGAA